MVRAVRAPAIGCCALSNPITEFVRSGSQRLRVARVGDGPPLLLINGLGAPLEMWEPLLGELSDYELITFDLPGSGLSANPRHPLGMGALAGIAADMMSAVGHPRAHVLGYSLGGLLAQEMAYRYPRSVDRLVLCATTPGFPSLPPRPLAAWLMLTPARYHSSVLAKTIVPLIAGGRTRHDPRARDANLPRRLAHPPTLSGYLNQLYAASGFSSHGWIRRIRKRTLVLVGDDDPLISVLNARYLARAISGADLYVMRGAGHLMLLDEPRTAARVIRRFLED